MRDCAIAATLLLGGLAAGALSAAAIPMGDGSRRWWTSVYRTGGWVLLRRWADAFREDGLLSRLAEAKRSCLAGERQESYRG